MTITGPNATFSLGRPGNDAAGADAPPAASHLSVRLKCGGPPK
ncbi:hypothetical protein ABIA94_006282 [Bradyrhizobium sp. LA7.1]